MEQARRIVLVIDDDPESCALAVAVLSVSNEVLQAADGLQGIKLARQHHPQLVVTDVMMPRMTGPEFLRAMNNDSALASVPVLMMTAWDMEPTTKGMLESYQNMKGILKKPLDINELSARVEKILGPAPRSGPAAPMGRTKRILVIDDDATEAEGLRLSAGTSEQVACVSSGGEGLKRLKELGADIVLLDLIMPGMTGMEVLRGMQADPALKAIPVVLVTAARLDAREVAVLRRDFPNLKGVLGKPIDPAAVRAAVNI